MAKTDYIPPGDLQFLAWHDQFKAGVTANLVALGLVAADATQVNTDNTDLHAKITASNAADAAAKQATADKKTSRRNIEARVRAMARRIKAAPTYTAGLGSLVGIIGPEDTTDLSVTAPTLAGLDKRGGVVEITFDKSIADGVNIYTKRDGDAAFVFLARDTASPYVDNRPLLVAGKPELRAYKAVYVVADAEVSPFSAEITVNCAPPV